MKIIDMKKDDYMINRIIALPQCWKNGQTWDYSTVKRPDHGFYTVLRGKCEYVSSSGKTTVCNPGDVLYIPKGINYTVHFSCGSENDKFCRSLLINFNIRDAFGSNAAFGAGIKKISFDTFGEISKAFLNIIELYKQSRIPEIKSAFFDIISRLNKSRAQTSTDPVESVLKYIDTHFTSPVTVPHLAEQCALSETSFRRKFKEAVGESPVKYINSLRISKSKELLRSSNITIDEIADFLSFYDRAHFCKVFKSHTGVSPNAYRKKHTANR